MIEALGEIIEVSGNMMQELRKVMEQMKRVDGRLSDYGIDEFEEVISALNLKMSTSADDSEEE